MKHIKLFEQFVNENDKLDAFLNKKIKNPATGREVKISSMIDDKENPLYKKLQAKKAEIEGEDSGDDDEMKEAIAELKELKDAYSEKFTEVSDIRKEIVDLKNDIKEGDDEEMVDMQKKDLEEKEEELDSESMELDHIKQQIDEVKEWIKENK
jgi:hypothetical protein